MSTTDHAFFYNSEGGDRVYDAESFELWLKKFFTTGVFMGDCEVTARGDMSVIMSSGYANVDGKVKMFDTAQTLQIETASATYPRIDTVVIERNDTDRDITVKVVTGTYSLDPVITEPVRENGIYQIVLAEIYVDAGITGITQEMVTDVRTDTYLCGIVTGAVTQYDFNSFKLQYAEWESEQHEAFEEWEAEQQEKYGEWTSEQEQTFEEWLAEHQDLFESWREGQEDTFEKWFATIQDILDTNIAAWLEREVTEIGGMLATGHFLGRLLDSEGSGLTTDDGRQLMADWIYIKK